MTPIKQLYSIQIEFKDFLEHDIHKMNDEQILEWFEDYKNRAIKIIHAYKDDETHEG